jgi:hypothetical protein
VAFRFIADQKAKPMPNPSRSRHSDDAMAAELCMLLLLSGRHEGRFAMSGNALMANSCEIFSEQPKPGPSSATGCARVSNTSN